MRANFIVEKLKPLIPYLGNNEALKLHLNRAILNANGDFKLAIKNIGDIPDGNLPTPTRNLLNEFKNALKDIEQVVKSQANEPTQIKAENQVNLSKTKEPTQEPVKAEAKKEAENLAQYRKDIETKYNINPIKEFGTNYAEFYHDGANAIRKLLVERQGQVAGAFERKELGDIDLVWGEAKAANGDIKGYGLSKIEAKHLNDFASFYGDTPQEKLINGLNEIIKNGKIINENGVDTIWYKKDNDYYLIGLSKGFYNKGDNNWIITVYEKTNLSIDKKARIDKALKGGDSKTISAYAEIKSSKTPKLTTAENSTTTANKSQAKNMMGGFSTMALQKAILHLGSGAIGGAINANAEQDPSKKHEAFVKGFLLGAGGSVAAIKTLESSAKLAPQLARISQGIAKDLPMILNDRPDIVGKALGKSPKDNYNYIFGGENAIGANKAKLKTAREMVKNGADESQIWTKTGWYKDIDGKWKFEINPLGGKFKKVIKDLFDAKAFKQNNREKLEVLQDRAKINDKYQTNLNNLNATLSQQASIITKAKDGLKLSEVLDDKKLFNAYPQLRDLKVRFDELEGQMSMYDGYYNKTLDEIVLNSKLYNKPEMLRSILYHEIQHKIQSIEGFASGGMGKDGLEYRRLAGEVEARNEQTRLISSELNNAKLERTTDLDDLEKIVKVLPKSQANEQISKELIALKKQDMALDNEYGKISPQRDKEIDRLTDELDNRFNALVGQIDKDELATALLKVYNKTKHPNATADVIPELRKVVFNDSDVSASYTPKQKEVRGVSEMDARNLVKNISLNKDIAIQLQPKADLLNLAKDFSNV
ncbi:LPD23 domain-containing protein, partial [Campylobacter porcelli]|nr:LPD23 domain-containing protein [Campylobacter sp. CX2-4855-23]